MGGELTTILWVTAEISLLAALVATALGVALAYLVTLYGGRKKSLADVFLTLPMVLPPTVLGFGLLWLLGREGVLGQLVGGDFSLVFTFWGAVAAGILVAFPLAYRSARGAFAGLGGNLLDAARTLGFSEVRIFFSIAVPLARNGIAAGALLAFARSVGEFGATLLVGGNIPGITQTLSLRLYEAAQAGNNREAVLLSAVALVFGFSLLLGLEKLMGSEK